MAMIQNDWLDAIGGEFRKPYYKELYQFVKEEYHTHVIYPPADDIFNAFHLTPFAVSYCKCITLLSAYPAFISFCLFHVNPCIIYNRTLTPRSLQYCFTSRISNSRK